MRRLILVMGLCAVAAAAPPPDTCTRRFIDDAALRAAPPGKATTIDALLRERPTAGRFTVEGFIQSPHHCGKCPEGASCKPCEETVWLSAVKGAYKGSLSPSNDLLVHLTDASRLDLLGHYQLTVELCAHHDAANPLPDLELRGYRPLDPPVVSPRERLAPLRWMLGAWQCTGQIRGGPSEFTLGITETLNGAWFDMHMVMKTQAEPFQVIATFGYALNEGWVRYDRNSNGGRRQLTSSEGPVGEKITFATVAAAGGFREELSRTSAGMSGRIDVFEDGKWSPAATFSCTLK